jgi:arylsulfatase A-like enzyme
MEIPNDVTRRRLLGSAALGTVALASGVEYVFGQRVSGSPNIVYIMADDLGYADVSCYGRREYRTPAIDSIATQGMKFLQAYANSSVCSATRAALMTGRYQYRLRVGLEEPIGADDDRMGLPPEHPTLPSLLKKVGYGATLIGKWHLGKLPNFGPQQSGYDHFWGFRGPYLDYYTHKNGPGGAGEADLWDDGGRVEQQGYLTDLIGGRAVKVIGDYAKARQPFLLSIHFNAPHWPWEAPNDEAHSKTLRTMADYDGGSQNIYAGMVTQMDVNIGKILRALDTNGIARNTIVVFTSDNGGERFSDNWPFSGRKTELLEGGLRIPAVVRWPGHIKAGSATQQSAITMDWVPTFLAAAGATADPAYPLDGMSLLPALTQGAAPVPRKLFWRYRFNAQRAYRDGDMKWLRINENLFLFNVVEDPLERANLSIHFPEIHKRMAQEYAAWEATMLPEEPAARSVTFFSNQLADHMGNRPPADRGGSGKKQ